MRDNGGLKINYKASNSFVEWIVNENEFHLFNFTEKNDDRKYLTLNSIWFIRSIDSHFTANISNFNQGDFNSSQSSISIDVLDRQLNSSDSRFSLYSSSRNEIGSIINKLSKLNCIVYCIFVYLRRMKDFFRSSWNVNGRRKISWITWNTFVEA